MTQEPLGKDDARFIPLEELGMTEEEAGANDAERLSEYSRRNEPPAVVEQETGDQEAIQTVHDLKLLCINDGENKYGSTLATSLQSTQNQLNGINVSLYTADQILQETDPNFIQEKFGASGQLIDQGELQRLKTEVIESLATTIIDRQVAILEAFNPSNDPKESIEAVKAQMDLLRPLATRLGSNDDMMGIAQSQALQTGLIASQFQLEESLNNDDYDKLRRLRDSFQQIRGAMELIPGEAGILSQWIEKVDARIQTYEEGQVDAEEPDPFQNFIKVMSTPES
jgi:hypothetical protein